MTPSGSNRWLVVSLAVVSAVGVADAAISQEWDLFVVLLLGLTISLALLTRLEGSRPDIPVRRDLVAWFRERSEVSGESIGVLTDRALVSYRERYGHASLEPSHKDR